LLRSERKSFRRFLALYALLMLGIFSLASYVYYRAQEQLMLTGVKSRMIDYAAEQIRRLRELHYAFPFERTYPRDPRFRSAIYDLEYVRIFSTLHSDRVDFLRDIYRRDGYVYFVKLLDSYYLGAKYLFIEVPEDRRWLTVTLERILIAGLILGALMAVLGYFLARLFLRPMRRSIELLDRFIQDTTHELNTPLSAILGNIEMIESRRLEARDRKRFERIALAARTVSTLYEDLKFLTLERHRPPEDEPLDMKALLEERLEFFALAIRSKQITLERDLAPAQRVADRRLMARLIDNLLSNAIKYNRRGGMIRVRLRPRILEIEDSGIGMAPDEVAEIFQRYRRFSESEGGFGLGLDIVRRIAEHYGMTIDISSEKGEGTRVRVIWESDHA
jgi:two-component system OmpR family sensor kinase